MASVLEKKYLKNPKLIYICKIVFGIGIFVYFILTVTFIVDRPQKSELKNLEQN